MGKDYVPEDVQESFKKYLKSRDINGLLEVLGVKPQAEFTNILPEGQTAEDVAIGNKDMSGIKYTLDNQTHKYAKEVFDMLGYDPAKDGYKLVQGKDDNGDPYCYYSRENSDGTIEYLKIGVDDTAEKNSKYSEYSGTYLIHSKSSADGSSLDTEIYNVAELCEQYDKEFPTRARTRDQAKRGAEILESWEKAKNKNDTPQIDEFGSAEEVKDKEESKKFPWGMIIGEILSPVTGGISTVVGLFMDFFGKKE